jgi:integrase/recombinase XerD
MKLTHTFTVLFWICKQKKKEELYPIYARITIDGKRIEIATKKWIEENKWSSEGHCAKGNNEEARAINQFLNLLKGDIEKIYLRISIDDRIPHPSRINYWELNQNQPIKLSLKRLIIIVLKCRKARR